MKRKVLAVLVAALLVLAVAAPVALAGTPPMFSYLDADPSTPDEADATARIDGYGSTTGVTWNISVSHSVYIDAVTVTVKDLSVGTLAYLKTADSTNVNVYGAFLPATVIGSNLTVPGTVYVKDVLDDGTYKLKDGAGTVVGRFAPFEDVDLKEGQKLTFDTAVSNADKEPVIFDATNLSYVASFKVEDSTKGQLPIDSLSAATKQVSFKVGVTSSNLPKITVFVRNELKGKSTGQPVALEVAAYDKDQDNVVANNQTVTGTFYALKLDTVSEIYDGDKTAEVGDVYKLTFTGTDGIDPDVLDPVSVYVREGGAAERKVREISDFTGKITHTVGGLPVEMKVVGSDGTTLFAYDEVISEPEEATPAPAKLEVSATSLVADYGAKDGPAIKVRVLDTAGKPIRENSVYVTLESLKPMNDEDLPYVNMVKAGADWIGDSTLKNKKSTDRWDGVICPGEDDEAYDLASTDSNGWFQVRLDGAGSMITAGDYKLTFTYSLAKKGTDSVDDAADLVVPGVTASVTVTVPAREMAPTPEGYTGAKVLRVFFGTNYYEADGKPGAWSIDLGMPYLDLATNRTYVPVRAIANQFGVSNDQITWAFSPEGKLTVVITTPFGRTITIDQRTNTISYSGNATGSIALDTDAIQLKNGRTYVPFRFLAYAFGLSGNQVTWGGDWVQFDWTALP